jgi:Arc/MetJ family transcription regulator
MRTNIDIDENLLQQAMELSGLKTKKATVNEALAQYVRMMKQKDILELLGQIDFDPDYDYKAARKAR